MKCFLTGSHYFFNKINGFKSKDIDNLYLVESPQNFTMSKQISFPNECKFFIVRHTPEEYINWYINTKVPMSVIKFLNKEFCEEIGFTINHLNQLASVFNRMDAKHYYAKLIFDYYIANNDFSLTDEQLNIVYENYKSIRIINN